MIQNDIDIWCEALKECHLEKAVLPTSRGYLIENVDSYNKMQAILNSPAMEQCHKYLYNLDVEDLEEDEIQKIDELYALGQERGFIPPDEPEQEETADLSVDIQPEEPVVATDITTNSYSPSTASVPNSSYTIMYSAMKDGQIKTGEAYSNAISTRAAKADVLAKLAQIGYDNITILAIEASDPDFVTTNKEPAIGQLGTAISDNETNEAETNKSDDKKSEAADANDDAEDTEDTTSDDSNADDNADTSTELSNSQKSTLKDQFKKTFKEAMLACNFEEKSFDDLTLDQKIQLFTELSKKWNEKPDPSKFMSTDDMDKLNSTIMKG